MSTDLTQIPDQFARLEAYLGDLLGEVLKTPKDFQLEDGQLDRAKVHKEAAYIYTKVLGRGPGVRV